MEDNIKEMSMVKLEQLKKSIEKEIASRKQKEREEAEREIFKLLKSIQTLCDKYNISLYDEHNDILNLDEIAVII